MVKGVSLTTAFFFFFGLRVMRRLAEDAAPAAGTLSIPQYQQVRACNLRSSAGGVITLEEARAWLQAGTCRSMRSHDALQALTAAASSMVDEDLIVATSTGWRRPGGSLQLGRRRLRKRRRLA